MTNKEAIKILKEVEYPVNGDNKEYRDTAFEMAIKAPEQDPYEDEYIKVPKKALKYRTAGMVTYNAEWLKNHFDMERAIICGEQEPCDAISRQAGIDIIDSWLSCDDYNEAERHIMKAMLSELYDLPSVNPQPKTGHWIRMKAYEKWGCSECHTVFRFTFKEHDYCPNCGAKMVEPQESEG